MVNYVESQLKIFQNPNMEKVLKITRYFNPSWAERLDKITEGEIKDAIVSIVAQRNQIAHGVNAGITYSKIKTYYQNAIKLVELIERQCDGESI